MRTKTPLQWKIPYEISPEPMAGAVTGMGGVAVASRAFRGMRLPGACDANLGPLRKIEKGYTAGQMVETVVAGLMVGADCAEALDRLQGDEAVARILGYKPASVRSVRDWLEKCHDEGLVRRARETAGELALKASIPEPSTGLHALQAVLGVSAREASARLPDGSPRVATVDADATVVESGKRAATWTYTGEKGYQPMVAAWAECGVVLATEFRDGNVPAAMAPLACIRQAFAELPSCVRTYGCRGDSACDNQELLGWLDDEQRPGGPSGTIYYAISARMVPDLAEASRAVPDSGWTTFGRTRTARCGNGPSSTMCPPRERRSARPRRYIGLRLQGAGRASRRCDRKHCRRDQPTERGDKVIEWHREAGTIERIHDEIKNGLAGARLPSQKFGANAAWFALNAVAYNVMAALRLAADDPESRVMRIRSLRFDLLTVSARLTRFSRKITLRFAGTPAWVGRVIRLLEAFPCRVQPTG